MPFVHHLRNYKTNCHRGCAEQVISLFSSLKILCIKIIDTIEQMPSNTVYRK